MEIQIFDVAHGFCAYVIADNRNTMLIDCGHNDQTAFYPADYLMKRGCTGIERFFVTNYDEDHLSGLPRLRELSGRLPIQILNRNDSIDADQLCVLKRRAGPLGAGISALLNMMRTYVQPVTVPPDYPGVDWAIYFNEYPTFEDTNNLSLVLFIHYPGISIVFPGDLEKAGWRTLLGNAGFRAHLTRTSIFVASHHGRESGYTREVFELCHPDVVIISDEAKQYETQETAYARHARGITWNSTGTRRVLTTRRDGMLTVTPRNGGFYISASR